MDFSNEINNLKQRGLYRELKYFESQQAPYNTILGRKVMVLSSNNYLGLCNDERIKKAVCEAIHKYGVGSGGSRLLSGSFEIHKKLEQKIAQFKFCQDSIIFNNGFMANLGVISAICDKSSVVFCDRLNHASIIDGIRLSGAKLVVYKHCDVLDLEKKIKRYNNGRGLIVTDGVFSMDGDIAPMDDIVSIAEKYGLLTMVDDAHATGVIGKKGRGTSEYFNIKGKIDIEMGTLSKAIGSEGGYVAGKRDMIDFLRNKARSFIYSTAIAPHNVAAAIAGIDIIENEPQRIANLRKNSQYIKEALGLNMRCRSEASSLVDVSGITPIIPIVIGDAEKALNFSSSLLEQGIYIPAVRPPTVPEGESRLRLTVTALHMIEDLKRVADIMRKIL